MTTYPGFLVSAFLIMSVIARKIFQGLRTMEGMEMFTVLMMCTMNRRAQDCNVSEMVAKTITGNVT